MAKKPKKTQKAPQKHKCKLFPYKEEIVISLQDAGQKSGWQITAFNLPKTWQKVGQGEGVIVAVIDTGCDLDHPDLVRNLIVLPGSNFINPKKLPEDDNKHGTHSAGIICAENNDIGMVGVAPKARVMPIKALDANGNGNMENLAKAIRFAVANGANIISLSLGAPCPLAQVRKAIQFAASKGIPVFCAAGNVGNTKEIFYPANYPESIAIGSIDENFNRSKFSNTGENLDFMAPGGKILSTVPDSWYSVLSGTSMACPFAAGIAALFLSYHKKNKLDMPLETVKDYVEVLKKYTVPIKNKDYAGKHFFEGFGIIDPEKLYEWLEKNGK